jgi:hypothetical protein
MQSPYNTKNLACCNVLPYICILFVFLSNLFAQWSVKVAKSKRRFLTNNAKNIKNCFCIYVTDGQTKTSPALVCQILKLCSTPSGFKDCTLLANSSVAARLRLPLTSLVLRISAVPVRPVLPKSCLLQNYILPNSFLPKSGSTKVRSNGLKIRPSISNYAYLHNLNLLSSIDSQAAAAIC